MVQYSYAKNIDGKIIDVTTLSRDQDLGTYFCVGCEEELIPHLGTEKVKHFHHKSRNCSRETYLHNLVKIAFYVTYKKCKDNGESFILEYPEEKICNYLEEELGVACQLGRQANDFDLVREFPNIKLEKKDGKFFPDIRLHNSKTSIYVEVAVTHESEEQKIESGNRIIEFLIAEEDDLELITAKRIKLDNEKIKRYNFKETPSIHVNCNGNCETTKKVFRVFKSGKTILNDIRLSELKKLIENNLITKYKIIQTQSDSDYYLSYLFKQNVVKTHEDGVNIKNCFLCRYHAKNKNHYRKTEMPIFCKFLEEEFLSNKAVNCEYYRPDKSAYSEYKKDN